MRVRAIKMGYYELKRKKEGTEFTLIPIKGHVQENGKLVEKTFSPEEQFTPRWMEKVLDEPKVKSKSRKSLEEVSDSEEAV